MSNSEKAPVPGTAGKIGLSYVFTKVFFSALTRMVTSPFKGKKGAPTYFRDVAYAAIRTQLRNASISQSRFLTKTTTQCYYDAAKQLGFQPESIDLPNGVQAHWIGEKDAEVTLVYFHGGGYALPCTPAHLQYFHGLTKQFNSQPLGPSVSVLMLAYTLAPDAEYPTQLAEASTLISYLLKTLNRSPSSLILTGDSAGGNLVLSLLSHILHPHPSAVGKIPVIDLKEPFRAALLISPWVSFATHHDSFKRNAETDVFDHVALDRWAKAFLGQSQRQGILTGDSYNEPLIAESGWWSGMDKVVSEVNIWAGNGEVFIDGIRALGEKFKEGWVRGGADGSKVLLMEGDKMCHEGFILSIALGIKKKEKGTEELEQWMRSKL